MNSLFYTVKIVFMIEVLEIVHYITIIARSASMLLHYGTTLGVVDFDAVNDFELTEIRPRWALR